MFPLTFTVKYELVSTVSLLGLQSWTEKLKRRKNKSLGQFFILKKWLDDSTAIYVINVRLLMFYKVPETHGHV